MVMVYDNMEKTDNGYTTLKQLKMLKSLILEDWNIEFCVDAKVFANIIQYLEKLREDIPFRFDDRGLTIKLYSDSQKHYSELHFKAGEELVEGDVLSGYKFYSGSDNNYKYLVIDVRGFTNGSKKFFVKDEKVFIRIDTIKSMRVEFIFQNMTMWTEIISPKYLMVPNIPKNIVNVLKNKNKDKNNGDYEKAEFAMVAEDFFKICRMGHFKEEIRRDVDKFAFFSVDNDCGFFVQSGNMGKGRNFSLLLPLTDKDILEDIEYEEQKKIKDELVASSDDKNTKPAKEKKRKSITYDRLKALITDKPQSIIASVESIRVLSILEIVSDVKMTIVADTGILIETTFGGVKILCGVLAKKEKEEEEDEDEDKDEDKREGGKHYKSYKDYDEKDAWREFWNDNDIVVSDVSK